MNPAKIREEMRPRGQIRPAILELADKAGAYIIVSAKGSVSDAALHRRRNAMGQAVWDVPNFERLTLDFYDRRRLASWVSVHRSVVPWVREKIGRSLRGWQSYGDWARTPNGLGDKYLLDDGIKLQTGRGERLEIAKGIQRLREILNQPGSVIRLVGLSGLGKTRLAQALFDDQIGEHHLDPTLAAYADIADDPDPQPTNLASDLQASRRRAILVIDNCPPDLHRRISTVSRASGSTTSVITVEYDIHEDQPEETVVFRLEAASDDLIKRLVTQRFPDLSIISVQTIATFSGGNARVALSLADAIGSRDTIADLPDSDLLRRLVQQRHGTDESLQSAAEVCALVYSFQADGTGDQVGELGILSAMIGQSSQGLYSRVAELQRRGLVQRRSIWRAVLPHAVANRLAIRALQNIPMSSIQEQLVDGGHGRLLKSFARRLGYLHTSGEARAIVRSWLAVGGRLYDLLALGEHEVEIFRNIAPTDPDASLELLERTLARANQIQTLECRRYIDVLRSLAYESALFERSVKLISMIAEAGNPRERSNKVNGTFASLFYLYVSGTCATLDQRLATIGRFLDSEHEKQRVLGFRALRAALEAWQFDPPTNFDFGAHVRGPGYWPRSKEEVRHWYCSVLELTERVACSDSPAAALGREAIAETFETLWNRGGLYSELERVVRAI